MTPGKTKALFSIAITLCTFLVADVTAAVVDDTIQLNRQINSIEHKISFETVWDEKLRKAQQKLELLRDADSDLGRLFRAAVNALTRGESEQAIGDEITQVNTQLKPFFKIDNKGNLTLGSALQMLGIQTQFTIPGMTLLTPESLLTIIVGWQKNNRAAMLANQATLTRLQQQLPSHKSPTADSPGRLLAVEHPLQQQINGLAARMADDDRRIPLLQKVVRERLHQPSDAGELGRADAAVDGGHGDHHVDQRLIDGNGSGHGPRSGN